MTYEEHQEKLKEVGIKFNSLLLHRRKLQENFIAECRKFTNGEKVKIITPDSKDWRGAVIPKSVRFAFIKCCKIDDNELTYKIKKCKKDGTISLYTDYLYPNETIEKIKQPIKFK